MRTILSGIVLIMVALFLFYMSTVDYIAVNERQSIDKWNRKRQLYYRIIATGMAGLGIFVIVNQKSLYAQTMMIVFTFMIVFGAIRNLYNNLDQFHTISVGQYIKVKSKSSN